MSVDTLHARPRVLIPPAVLVLGGLLAANCAWSLVWPSPATAAAAALLWAAAAWRLFGTDARAAVLLLPFMTLHLSVMVSLIAIESGAHMKEMGARGAASPASALFAMLSLVFLGTAAAVYVRRRSLRAERGAAPPFSAASPSPLLAWAAPGIAAPVVAYLALTGLRNGFPLLEGIDRFQYRMNADVLTLNFLNLKFVIAALLASGAAAAPGRALRAGHHLIFAAYLAVSFLFGDKFFIIIAATCFYCMPFVLARPAGLAQALWRHAPLAIVALACVAGVTLFIYSGYGRFSLDTTLTRLGDRVAGQGQLWFLAVRDSSHWFGIDADGVAQNLRSLFANPAATYVFDHRIAAFYFVDKYAPSSLWTSFLHNGGTVTPTMVFEAYGLMLFGYLGLAAALLLMGALAGAVLEWLAHAMQSGNPVNVLLPAFVATQVLSVMSQGTLYSLLSLSAFKAYAAFLLLQWMVAECTRPGGLLREQRA